MWYLFVSIPDLCTLTYFLQACLAKNSLSLYKLTDLTSRYQITLNLTSHSETVWHQQMHKLILSLLGSKLLMLETLSARLLKVAVSIIIVVCVTK